MLIGYSKTMLDHKAQKQQEHLALLSIGQRAYLLNFKEKMIGRNLITLAKAIQHHEGWGPDDLKTLGVNEETPSFRNNNPGNLMASPWAIGNRGRFAYFYSEEIGFMALLWDLYQKCTGNTVTGLSGKSTLEQLMTVYAPPAENNTGAYITFIEGRTGFSRKMKLVELLAK